METSNDAASAVGPPEITAISTESGVSEVAKLNELVALYFPQAGPVKFSKIAVSPTSKEDEPGEWEKCSLNLFGLNIQEDADGLDWEAAQERVAQHGLQLMEVFLKKIYGRREDAMFVKVFDQLMKDLKDARTDETTTGKPREAETERLAEEMGHEKIMAFNEQKPSEETKERVMGPLLNAIYSVATNPSNPIAAPSPLPPAELPTVPSCGKVVKMVDPVLASTPSPADSGNDTNPITELYVHYQKSGARGDPPSFEIFQGKTILWGARGTYRGISVTLKAAYRKKNDAKHEAGRLIYERLLGDVGRFKRVSPDIEGDPEVSDVVVGTSNVVISEDHSGNQRAGAVTSNPISIENGPTKKTIEDYIKDLPTAPSPLTPPQGKRFISIVNEYCQRLRINAPRYMEFTISDSLMPAFRFLVENFDGQSFGSYAFTRKRDAQEDCAARIFEYLNGKGRLDSQGRCTNPPLRTASWASRTAPPRRPHPSPMGIPHPPPMGMPPFMLPFLSQLPHLPPSGLTPPILPEKRLGEPLLPSPPPPPYHSMSGWPAPDPRMAPPPFTAQRPDRPRDFHQGRNPPPTSRSREEARRDRFSSDRRRSRSRDDWSRRRRSRSRDDRDRHR